jgi:hypothetical protein
MSVSTLLLSAVTESASVTRIKRGEGRGERSGGKEKRKE